MNRNIDRIDKISNLPLFFDLNGKPVVIAGFSDQSLWKVELFLKAGANVLLCKSGDNDVVDEDFFNQVEAFKHNLPNKINDLTSSNEHDEIENAAFEIKLEEWYNLSLSDKKLAIGDFQSLEKAKLFRDHFCNINIPVNIIDKPNLCDFKFSSIVNHSPLVVGISTNGSAPVFGQWLRSLIEMLLPEKIDEILKLFDEHKSYVKSKIPNKSDRRKFWFDLAHNKLETLNKAPNPDLKLKEIIKTYSADIIGNSKSNITILNINNKNFDDLSFGIVRKLINSDLVIFCGDLDKSFGFFTRREAKFLSLNNNNIKNVLAQIKKENKSNGNISIINNELDNKLSDNLISKINEDNEINAKFDFYI